MTLNEITVWGIHGGRAAAADALFLKKNLLALGWHKMGDLSTLSPDREAFKACIAQAYPEIKAGAIPVNAGQLFRFLYELNLGDYVVYPSQVDKLIHIGQVAGEYRYNPSQDPHYPNTRSVQWIKQLPRTSFTQGALYEIGSAMSFFQVRTFAEEFLKALEGKIEPPTGKDDATVAYVVEEIEQTTRDFILKQLSQELKGHPLAHFVAHLLQTMGYHTRISPVGPDGGVDIIAHKDELGFEPPIIKVQVKSSSDTIKDSVVSALYGKLGPGEHALMVCLGRYTPPAQSFARSKSNLRLIGADELVDLIFMHYEQFDSRYKGLLPLKRVYIPEVIAEEES
jgi:restriction system protein